MRWETLGLCAFSLWCGACGESATNKPNAAVAGAASGGSSAGDGSAGSKVGAAGAAGNGVGGSAGAGAGVGMCSGSTNQTGGTRLKGQFWVTAEGDRAWESWWDTELNAACDFNGASDGSMRCIPNNWNDSREVFSDAACTQPVYTRMEIGPCTPADYIMGLAGGTCEVPGGYAFWQLGAKASPTAVFSKTAEGGCVADVLPEQPLYAKGAEVPPTTFLEGQRTVFDAPTSVKTWGIAASDGSKTVWGWQDTKLADQRCYFQPAEDGKTRCLPTSYGFSGYSDSMCSMPTVAVEASCDPNPKPAGFMLQPPDYECVAAPWRAFKVGEPYTGGQYRGTADSCLPSAGTAPPGTYLTTPAAPETFLAVNATVDESDPGRLKPRYYDAGSDGCWFHNFWDAELKTACGFAEATDMKQRCLPAPAVVVFPLYSDAQCSVPNALAPLDECPPTPLPEYTTNPVPDDCERRSEVYKLGETVLKPDLPALWIKYGSVCQTYVPLADKYARLTLVDPSLFMAGEAKVE